MRLKGARLLLVAVLAITLTGCFPIIKPLPTQSAGKPTAAISSQTTPQPALLEQRLMELEWPETLREKDSGLIVLTIAMSEQAQPTMTVETSGINIPIDIPNIYDTHNIVAVARLDLAGMEAYRENIREPMQPGQTITFPWSIRANEAGTYQGVVWLRLELTPKGGGQTDEILLMARTIEIKVVTILGMSGGLARFLGGVGLVAGTVLGYPFIQARIAEWQKRRKGSGPRAGRRSPPAKPVTEVHSPEEK
jgi:hypothetical protein